jgi:hypothetical protein
MIWVCDDAWKTGLKGIATFRQNSVLGAVLSAENSENIHLNADE